MRNNTGKVRRKSKSPSLSFNEKNSQWRTSKELINIRVKDNSSFETNNKGEGKEMAVKRSRSSFVSTLTPWQYGFYLISSSSVMHLEIEALEWNIQCAKV